MDSISNETAQEILKAREEHIKAQQTKIETPAIEDVIHEIKEEKASNNLGIIEQYKPKLSDFPEIGWKPLPVNLLPSGGMFYPEGTSIQIRSANVKEIRHFSTIDENDFLDGDDKLNAIMDSCCKVSVPNTARPSWKDLKDFDRFYVIYSIRDLTFKNGENKLTMNVACNTCGNVDQIEIVKESLNFFKVDDRLQKFYDPQRRTFVIRTKDGEEFPIFLPSLGITTFLKNFTRSKAQNKEFYDRTFLRMAPFLFEDWRDLNERTYKSMDEKTYGWSHKKISIVSGIIDVLADSINPEIQHTCTSCGSEVSATMNFQGGIKSLFLITDIFDQLDF